MKFKQNEETGRIAVGVEHTDLERPCLVREDGVGFEPESGDGLFGAFGRFHNDFEGTGVGGDRRVDRLPPRGGEGEPAPGATIYFLLPTLTSTDDE